MKPPWFLLQLSTSPFKDPTCQWMGIPVKLSLLFYFSRISAEHPENMLYFCFPLYLKNTKGNKYFLTFFPFPFIELRNMHSMHKTSPDAPGNHNRYPPAQKALMCGKAQVPHKEMTFPFWATHTHSLGNSSKGKRPQHVLHIDRSYIHGQSRVSEWNSFMCLWLISQS